MFSEYIPESRRYEEAAPYRRCGRSGVMLPPVSLGLWHHFGDTDAIGNQRAILRYAFDHGITHFDLANNYGPPYGSAERNFGTIYEQDFRTHRHELFIATKAGYDMWPGPYGNWGSRKYLLTSLDQSLERMHLEYVDLFYSHRYDPNTPVEETLEALVSAVHSGKALYVGISRWPLEATLWALTYLRERHVPCLAYQGRLNLLDRAPENSGVLEGVERLGTGFVSFSPLAQGLLTDRYLNGIAKDSRMAQERFLKSSVLDDGTKECLRRLNVLAMERGETLAEMALGWILSHKEVTTVLVGAGSPEQLARNLKGSSVAPFSQEEMVRIEEAVALSTVY